MNNTPDSIDIKKLEEQVKKIPSGIRWEIMQRFNENGCTELVKLFILQGQISGIRDAALYGQLDTVKIQYELGNNAYTKETYIGCMEDACKRGHTEIVDFFINTVGVDVNVNVTDDNKKPTTPLMLASKNSKLEVVKCLLENGATTDFDDYAFNEAFNYAVKNNDKAIVEALFEATHQNRVSVSAIYLSTGNVDILKFLVGKEHDAIDWIKLAICAIAKDSVESLEWILVNSGVEYDYDYLAKIAADDNTCVETANLLERYGARNYLKEKKGRWRLAGTLAALED